MFEKVVLENLISNVNFGKQFIEYVDISYLEAYESKLIFKHIKNYFQEYKKLPSLNELSISVTNDNKLDEKIFNDCCELLNEIKTSDKQYNPDWLVKETKKWIRNKAFENVIIESAEKLQNNESIDDMMQKVKTVFSINFNETIGINFIKGFEKQQEYYQTKREKFASCIDGLNLVCDGGIEKKTLNMLLAPTNTGKTSGLIALSAGYLRAGYKVLYVTCEMREENIRQRIEANFLDIPINDVPKLPPTLYAKRMKEVEEKFTGNIYIKEYPTQTANVNHLRALLDNLATKEDFVPDILVIDYLNILKSATVTKGDSYAVVKSVAEEVRGLSCEYSLATWSATQTNRGGDGASDLNLTDSSDSYGVPMTVDLEVAIIQTPEMFEQQRQVWKCLKTRYSELKHYKFSVTHIFNTCKVIDIAKKDDKSVDNSEQTNFKAKKVNNTERLKEMGIDFD